MIALDKVTDTVSNAPMLAYEAYTRGATAVSTLPGRLVGAGLNAGSEAKAVESAARSVLGGFGTAAITAPVAAALWLLLNPPNRSPEPEGPEVGPNGEENPRYEGRQESSFIGRMAKALGVGVGTSVALTTLGFLVSVAGGRLL